MNALPGWFFSHAPLSRRCWLSQMLSGVAAAGALVATVGIASAADEGQKPAFTVEVDISQAPECQAFAEKSKALIVEWYPKINELLWGKGHALPYPRVKISFVPMKGVAATTNGEIRVAAEWVTKKAPNDYGMVIHELTHVVQDYRGKGEFWVTEGIADYIRDHDYEPGVRKNRVDPQKSSYKQGYGTAGFFLAWLEQAKNPEIVRKLNAASREGKYRPELISELCGADLQALWTEYVAAQAN